MQYRCVLLIILLVLILTPCRAAVVVQQGGGYSKQLYATMDSVRESLSEDEFLEWLVKQGADSESNDDAKLAWGYYSYYFEFARLNKVVELMVDWGEGQSQHEQIRHNLNHIRGFVVKHSAKYPFMTALAHNCEILSKGMLLNSETAIYRSILKTGNKL